MDYATIIVAALSLVGTLVGSFLANSKNTALIAYRLEELERKVQKHNNIVERIAVLENTVRLDEEEIKRLREENNHD